MLGSIYFENPLQRANLEHEIDAVLHKFIARVVNQVADQNLPMKSFPVRTAECVIELFKEKVFLLAGQVAQLRGEGVNGRTAGAAAAIRQTEQFLCGRNKVGRCTGELHRRQPHPNSRAFSDLFEAEKLSAGPIEQGSLKVKVNKGWIAAGNDLVTDSGDRRQGRVVCRNELDLLGLKDRMGTALQDSLQGGEKLFAVAGNGVPQSESC